VNLLKIYKSVIFCFMSQIAFSLLLLYSFASKTEFYIVNWKIMIGRFICACLIHYTFESKVTRCLQMMKYAGMHTDKFTFPKLSALIAFCQLLAVIFVELVNILNLTFIGDIKSLVINYVALGEISAFDEYFLMMYRT